MTWKRKSVIKINDDDSQKNTDDAKWLRFSSNPNSKQPMNLMLPFCAFSFHLRHEHSIALATICWRHRLCAQGICRHYFQANSINYLLMLGALAIPKSEPHTQTTQSRPNYASNSELRQSNIFWITSDYLHILKNSLNGNNTISIDKRAHEQRE